MGYKSTLTFSSCLAVALTACYADEKPEDPDPVPDPDPIVDVAPEYRQICENHLRSLQGSFDDPTLMYLMRLDRSSGTVFLENGDFEDPGTVPPDLVINTDPAYVYSGEGSVRTTDSKFDASIQEIEHFSGRDLVSIKFWLYSAHDEPIDYEVSAYGMMLDRLDRDDGIGFSGHSQMSQQSITVEPHSWIAVNIDFEDYQQCLNSLSIIAFVDDVVFYIDDIEIEAELIEAE